MDKAQKANCSHELENETVYTIQNRTFLVVSSFRSASDETLGSALIKLMRSEIDNKS